ncbi:27810_t:CDS:2, partial [Racocetra persica]
DNEKVENKKVENEKVENKKVENKKEKEQNLEIKTKKDEDVNIKVACITTDYSMQNVLLQMGLNLVSVEGARIKKVKSWVLRCHACF